MWKIFFAYEDGSKVTITGKHKDIPLELAVKYYNEYAAGHVMRRCEYQQYPKNKYPAMYLMDKIEQLKDMREDEELQKMKLACMVCCPLCDEEKCVGRFNCETIKEYMEKENGLERVIWKD